MHVEVSFYRDMFDYYNVENLMLVYIFDVDLSRTEGYVILYTMIMEIISLPRLPWEDYDMWSFEWNTIILDISHEK